MRQRLIIGVIGGSNGVPDHVTARAFALGGAIADSGAIVLTGGIGDPHAKTVKDAAVAGAAQGRIISIVKHGEGVQWRTPHHLVVHSGLRDARNVLNGHAADLLVALWGGGGTLSEVAFAALAGRPVLFLDGARLHLRSFVDGMTDIATQAVTDFADDRYAEANLRRAVTPLLESAANDVSTIEETLRRALIAPHTGTFPHVPQQPELERAYHEAVAQLDVFGNSSA